MISEVVVMVPWTTPVVASGFLATGGDWRAAVFQIFLDWRLRTSLPTILKSQ